VPGSRCGAAERAAAAPTSARCSPPEAECRIKQSSSERLGIGCAGAHLVLRVSGVCTRSTASVSHLLWKVACHPACHTRPVSREAWSHFTGRVRRGGREVYPVSRWPRCLACIEYWCNSPKHAMLAGCSIAVCCKPMFANNAMLSTIQPDCTTLPSTLTLPRVRAALWSCYISKVQQMGPACACLWHV